MLEDLKLGKRYDGLLYLVESERNPPTIRSHRHVELELNLVVRGTISYVVGGQRFTFPARTLLWLFPAQEHQLVNRTSDAQNYVAVFKPALLARACRTTRYAGLRRRGASAEGVLHTQLEPEAFDLVRRTMDAMMVGAPSPDVLNREAGFGPRSSFRFQHDDSDGLNAGLRHLLLLCWRCQGAVPLAGGAVALHPAVRRALEILGEAADGSNLALAEVARRSGTSETHLSRLFARQVGLPLSRYRNRVRLARFFKHYRGPEQRTITEAMYAAGFGSYAQFHRVFTEAYGHSPRTSLRTAPPKP